jgi:hypothetical protein
MEVEEEKREINDSIGNDRSVEFVSYVVGENIESERGVVNNNRENRERREREENERRLAALLEMLEIGLRVMRIEERGLESGEEMKENNEEDEGIHGDEGVPWGISRLAMKFSYCFMRFYQTTRKPIHLFHVIWRGIAISLLFPFPLIYFLLLNLPPLSLVIPLILLFILSSYIIIRIIFSIRSIRNNTTHRLLTPTFIILEYFLHYLLLIILNLYTFPNQTGFFHYLFLLWMFFYDFPTIISVVFWIIYFLLVCLGYIIEGAARLVVCKCHSPCKNRFRYKMSLRQLKINSKFTYLKMVFYSSRKKQISTCSICFDEFKEFEQLCELSCNSYHVFHCKCVIGWLKIKETCPICRKKVKI